MHQEQKLLMKDIYMATESEQPDYTSKLQPANRQQEKATDHFQTSAESQEAKRQWALQFDQLLDTWDGPIIQALNQLAQCRWPPEHVLGLIPVSTYQLRDEQVDEVHLWWVEHEILPQDENHCMAYQVCLILNRQGQPVLMVQSGTRAYPINPLTVENLKATVAKVGQDPPLIIARNMGKDM